MSDAHIEVLGIGNAIVDVIANSSDEFLSLHGMDKGGMALIDCSFSLAFRATYEIVGSTASLTAPRFFLGPDEPAEYVITREGHPTETRPVAPGSMFEREVDALSLRIRGEHAYVLPAEDAYNNMRVLDAIAASARSGERVALTD